MSPSNAATAVFEDVTNRLLRLDRDTLRRLGDIQNKVICVQIRSAGSDHQPELYFLPSEGGLQMRSQYDGTADVTISGNPPAFLRMALGQRAKGAFASGEMQISGDLELGQRFQRIIKKIDIDWEEITSHYVGDTAARKLGNLVRGARSWRRQAFDTLRLDTTEYLQEEARLLPRKEHIDEHMGAVDQLRADVDRLEKRINRCRKRKA
ncbi:MAG: SCP2 domain-containing protein [Acidiferrobacterales bacterium]